MPEYEYEMNGDRTLDLECPCCGDGWLTVSIGENGKVGKIETYQCRATCENDIASGKADEAILEAKAIADKLEADKDWSEAWNRRYQNSDGVGDSLHRMREAAKYK